MYWNGPAKQWDRLASSYIHVLLYLNGLPIFIAVYQQQQQQQKLKIRALRGESIPCFDNTNSAYVLVFSIQ